MKFDVLSKDHVAAPLAQEILGCMKWSTYDQFNWLLEDVLGSMGRPITSPPPEEARDHIFRMAGMYAEAVIASPPFMDVLGPLYMEIGSHGMRKQMAQFFTPWHIASLMSRITLGTDHQQISDDELVRVGEPCAGSGVMLLACCDSVLTQFGPEALRRYSLTAIDLDRTCTLMTATQLLANCAIHDVAIGEVLVYHGNSLAVEEYEVIVHASDANAPPATKIPARDPGRLAAAKDLAKQNPQLALFGDGHIEEDITTTS